MRADPAPPVRDHLAVLAGLPGVADAVDEARTAVDGLLGHRVMRRAAVEVATESALRGARATAALEGAGWTLSAVRAFEAADGLPGTEVVHGALRVTTQAPSLARTVDRAPLHALARLHLLAAADLQDEDSCGRPRGGGTVPDDPLGLGPAPDGDSVAVRLDALAELLTRPTDAPALVVAAVVHGEVLALRPFATGNGLVARAAERLVLHARGLDTRAVCAPETGHAEAGPGYGDALRGYLSGTPAGVAGWVRHCARAVRLGARDGLAVCEAMRRG
ncbi:MAG: oxidoreductase [Actinomycetes bacterium]